MALQIFVSAVLVGSSTARDLRQDLGHPGPGPPWRWMELQFGARNTFFAQKMKLNWTHELHELGRFKVAKPFFLMYFLQVLFLNFGIALPTKCSVALLSIHVSLW